MDHRMDAIANAASIRELAVIGVNILKSNILKLSTQLRLDKRHSLAQNVSQQHLVEIGKGQCGTVYGFCHESDAIIIKLPNSAEKVDQLFNDFIMHALIQQALKELGTVFYFHVPSLEIWASPKFNEFWVKTTPMLPMNTVTHGFALMSQRIFPIPWSGRKTLLDQLGFSVSQGCKRRFLARPENKALIRLYLGRREMRKPKSNLKNLTLQNFPLHVNDMEQLNLDTTHFAQTMAQALAIMHWKAGVDGNDVEFVLGRSPKRGYMPNFKEIIEHGMWWALDDCIFDFGNQKIGIWLIDFDQCSQFEENKAGLKKIVDAFFYNDPYYPRPNSGNDKDEALWAAFRQVYLQLSSALTQSSMPKQFIAEVEAHRGSVGRLFD